MPVPMVMPMACRAPRAAPTHHSPSTAQLASLSSAAGSPSRSWMIWRSGMFTQPRLGVSSTMPRLVSSGPGAPTPTPRISAPGTSRLVSAMARSASATSRSTTSLAPASAWVGSLAVASTLRAVLGHAADHEVGPTDVNAQYESHAAPPRLPRPPPPPRPTRPTTPSCSDGGPAGRPAARGPSRDDSRAPDARPPGRARPRARSRMPGPSGPNMATTGVPTAVARCSGAESLVTSTAAPADQRRRRAQPQSAPPRCIARPARRGITVAASARVLAAAHDHHRPCRAPRPARRSRASAWCPRSSPAPAPRSPGRCRARAATSSAAARSLGGEARPGPVAPPAPAPPASASSRSTSWPCRPAAPGGCRSRPPGCPRSRPARRRPRAAPAPPSARSGAADTTPRYRRPRSRRPSRQTPGEPRSAPRLSYADYRGHGRMGLDQRGRGRRRHDVHRPVDRRQRRQQRGRQHHVAEEGGLDDQGGRTVGRSDGRLSPEADPAGSALAGPPSACPPVRLSPIPNPPAARPGRPPAESPRRRSASCASCPPSASRGACACG